MFRDSPDNTRAQDIGDGGDIHGEIHWLRAGFQTFATKLGDTSASFSLRLP